MSRLAPSLPSPDRSAVLLSIKPDYASLILNHVKRVEFRRSWAAHEVRDVVLYASAPVQKIVGLVKLKSTITGSPTALWAVCRDNGGGLSRSELRTYLEGKPQGVALMLGKVHKLADQLSPAEVFRNFVPPQSYRYLRQDECRILKPLVGYWMDAE